MKSANIKTKDFLARIGIIISMVIFGTIGIFRRYIPLPSGMLAMLRGLIGAAILFIIILITKNKRNLTALKQNLGLLILSGALIGFNWILLFEAYNYTSVATATLCYYMAPIFVIIASPIFLKEKLTTKQIVCTLTAFIGMILVSGIFGKAGRATNELFGVILGLGAALLYASAIILNKKLTATDSLGRTAIQLGSAGIVILPYALFFESFEVPKINASLVILILIVGVIHTAIAYVLYFGAIKKLKAQTAAIYSYIDPIVAIVLSALILNENISFTSVIGSVLVLGSTLLNEINFKKAR